MACTEPPEPAQHHTPSAQQLQYLRQSPPTPHCSQFLLLKLFYGRKSFGHMMVDEEMVSSFYPPVRQTMDVSVANPVMEQN